MERIAYIDFDGTVANSIEQMIRVWNMRFRPITEKPLDPYNVTTWDGGIPHHMVEPVFAHKDFFNGLKIFQGFENAMNTLKDMGFKLVLYTKGSLMNISNKSEYVELFLNDIFDGWVFVGTNDLEMGKSQLDMSVEDGYSILIDDHIKNLYPERDSHKSNMPTYSICCKLSKRKDENWNKDWNGRTIEHWDELEKIILEIDNYETNVIR